MPYILIIVIFLADRLSKIWAADFLAANGPTQVHPYLTIQETYNRGIAFGLFQGVGPVVGWLTIGVVIGLFVYMMRLPRELWLVRTGMALIIGGALGNLIDRVWAGEVLDFIQSSLLWGIVNIADISINIGMVVMIIGSMIQKEPEPVVSNQLSVNSEQLPVVDERPMDEFASTEEE
jgi:signal peptidase II